jgi:uncharacterized SAM-binding protein YcdF (DUF218 family)
MALRFLYALLGICLTWLAGFIVFFMYIPAHVDDTQTVVDAVVVLTGGEGRVAMGFDIVSQGLAKRLFISGVNPGVSLKNLRDKQNINTDAPIDVSLGYTAENTYGNAQEAASWVTENHVTSIRLVTADYHMIRSVREFRRMLPDVKIIPHPVARSRPMNLATLRLYMIEYHKLLPVFVTLRPGQDSGIQRLLSHF